MGDLIDTTEMYLKTIYEMSEDGVTPMRARIVDRLGHSGPTVSQTVARMERDGLVVVGSNRKLILTAKGARLAHDVVRKHRLAERLLLDVIGLDWSLVHEEACRWEHVMSDQVEHRLSHILERTDVDPYGNPIPGCLNENCPAHPPQEHARVVIDDSIMPVEQLLEDAVACGLDGTGDGTVKVDAQIVRIGEPIQANTELIQRFAACRLFPGAHVTMSIEDGVAIIMRGDRGSEDGGENCGKVALERGLQAHLFVCADA